MITRGGNLSVFLNAQEYETLERNSQETGMNKSQITKMALAHFNNSNVLRELKKVRRRNEAFGDRSFEQIRGEEYEKKGGEQ